MSPVLVLLHGWASDSAVWADVVAGLTEEMEVYSVDLPGFAEQDQWLDDWSEWESYLTVVEARLPHRPLILVGWSLGGLVAMALAKRAFLHVKGLALLASSPSFVQQPDWRAGMPVEVFSAFQSGFARHPEKILKRFMSLQVEGLDKKAGVVRKLRRYVNAPWNVVALATGLEFLRMDGRSWFLELAELPKWVLLGERDSLIPVEAGAFYLKQGCEVSVVGAAGHALPLSHPEECVNWLVNIWRQHG